MFNRFYPKIYELSVFDVNYDILFKKGIRFLIFDLDNTLAPYYMPTPTDEVVALMASLRSMGFTVCILSNNKAKRVDIFNEGIKVFAVSKAGKPKKSAVMIALAKMGGTAKKAALIGDQLFTDIWCANMTNVYSVLVKPISDRDEWTVRLKRLPEKFVLNCYLRNRHNKKGGAPD